MINNSKLIAMLKKKFLVYFLFTLLSGILSQEAFAQFRASADVAARIVQPVAANEGAQMNFGRFSTETGGGEIKLAPNGNRSSSGTVVLNAGSYNAASFYLSGGNESTVSITLPSGAVILTNSANSKTLEVYNWESNPSAGYEVRMRNSSLTVNVGATLRIGKPEGNCAGMYSGTYSITFANN